MITISGIKLPLGSGEYEAAARARKLLGNPEGGSYHMRRMSYDLRRGSAVQVCSVVAQFDDPALEQQLAARCPNARYSEKLRFCPETGSEHLPHRPIVVGSGPAGLFAAYLLSQYGYRPILLERGADVDSRVQAVESFFAGGELDRATNIQFGEGGAGTFSDGKLTTRIGDELCEFVLNTFVKFGAPEDILYKAKPHIGTDMLRGVVKRMREAIEENGGEVRFLSRVDDIHAENGRLAAVLCADEALPCEVAVLACGHSARDTFLMLADKGLTLTAKPFSVGLRIEHLQSDVDRSLYGKLAGDPRLPKGEYNLSAQVGGRGVYTFCMCPGGQVVAAASEAGGTVTNGMSCYARDGENANSAVCVSVDGKDFGRNPYRALEFQRSLERAAFAAAGGDFAAPANDVASFMAGKRTLNIGRVKPSYPRELRGFDMEKVLGSEICRALRGGLAAFSQKMRCFGDGEAILTGVETRTSSPLRIARGEDRQAIGMQGLYPCGEGAGYAGGIMSAAVDGLRTASAIIERYKPY
ncbi:MAG: NAD(P)/FAD-dependent oxidoreductase [Oscillospiraceae bacterium]|nr:NAD(P)/FAD-dependent oxidoreductase [Oscillospiraceae bacterium]